MQTRYLYSLRFILAARDLLLVNAAFFIAFYLTSGLNTGLSVRDYLPYEIAACLLWLFSASWSGLYDHDRAQHYRQVPRSAWRGLALHFTLVACYMTFSRDQELSRFFIVAFYAVLLTFFLLIRLTGVHVENMLSRRFRIYKSVAVLGRNGTGSRLASYFRQHDRRFRFEGFLEDNYSKLVEKDGGIMVSTGDQIRQAADNGITDVYVSLAPERIAQAQILMEEAERQCVRLKFVLDLEDKLNMPFEIDYMGDFPVISLRREPLEDMQNRLYKRVVDIFFSLFVLVFVLSWLYPLLAVIIKLQSPGPVLFRQLRTGRNNQPFYCYKFRSMRLNNDSDTRQATKNDSRITPIGRFMRKYSLDEFPQFLNVLIGNMSISGPRPHMLKHTEQYSAIINRFMARHYLKPGITGWAQVNGLRGETRDPRLMERRVEHDIWYMENWSLWLDLKIICKTVVNLFGGEENAR
ncbi:undecaprenyl-phosphate glucose phosphotransferase [Chitinophaga cymbidii]|uniref:Undecaprenyl-phosphate glucose phosphotransferase n=1 Tax=Chitinophaga cymbidii TaxID=1096750 RepID=A0A512RMK8_9BACT|nr:undecaprenyl-phosphate glucose phosphotransferase [Chitinophaga cymbidii]GEP96910.1 undecaprenyl-phosphate glucose phosphotransferase [Chitinophaga cymbidii]